MQAWHARRCITLYNDIVRRPHLPREEEIRILMCNTGIDLTQYGRGSRSFDEADPENPNPEQDEYDDETDYIDDEESFEESCAEDDPCS